MKPKKPNPSKKKIEGLKTERGPDELLDYIQSCYNNEINPLINLMKSETIPDSRFENVIKRYLIITMVTLIEVAFKMSIHSFVKHSASSLDLSKLITPNANVKATDEEIIATIFNYQNVKDIDNVLSTLLSIDFFKTVKDIVFTRKTVYWEDDLEEKIFLENNWNVFLDIFPLRHKLIHTTDNDVDYSIDELEQIVNAVKYFIEISSMIIYSKYIAFEQDALFPEFYEIIGFTRIT